MPFQTIEVKSPKDLNVDISPYEIQPEVWSFVQNVTYDISGTARVDGAALVFDSPLQAAPIFHMPWKFNNNNNWIYASLNDVYLITPSGTETLMGTGYNASFLYGWQGNTFNGVGVLNNGIDAPIYTDTATTVADLPAWPASTTAQVIRPFKNFLIALNIKEPVQEFPSRVWWSDSADVGSVPDNWDYANPASRSGITDLADTPGDIIDGFPLGDTFVVYKEDAVWGLNFVGGTFVFNIRKLFDDDIGVQAIDCVAPYENKHFVLAKRDCYIHDGITKTSVMNDRCRTLLDSLDEDNFLRAKVVADQENKEILVYFPVGDDPAQTGLSQVALTWSWENNLWGVRELTNVSYINAGIVEAPLPGSGQIWDDDDGVWNEDDTFWNETDGAYSPYKLLAADYLTPQFLQLNTGSTWDGTPYTTVMEKIGVDFDSDANLKRIRAIYPHINAARGTEVDIEVGYEDPQRGGITWEGPYKFRVGIDRKIDCRVNGRNISVRFSSGVNAPWKLTAYTAEWMPTRARRG